MSTIPPRPWTTPPTKAIQGDADLRRDLRAAVETRPGCNLTDLLGMLDMPDTRQARARLHTQLDVLIEAKEITRWMDHNHSGAPLRYWLFDQRPAKPSPHVPYETPQPSPAAIVVAQAEPAPAEPAEEPVHRREHEPPPVTKSDEVLAYVNRHPGGVYAYQVDKALGKGSQPYLPSLFRKGRIERDGRTGAYRYKPKQDTPTAGIHEKREAATPAALQGVPVKRRGRPNQVLDAIEQHPDGLTLEQVRNLALEIKHPSKALLVLIEAGRIVRRGAPGSYVYFPASAAETTITTRAEAATSSSAARERAIADAIVDESARDAARAEIAERPPAARPIDVDEIERCVTRVRTAQKELDDAMNALRQAAGGMA